MVICSVIVEKEMQDMEKEKVTSAKAERLENMQQLGNKSGEKFM